MSSLPLTQALSEDNLFSQLNIPLSSKWPEIKKAYDKHSRKLRSEIDGASDDSIKKQLEQKVWYLDNAYHAFADRLSAENARVHETKEALKSVGLKETADWDRVEQRFEELRSQEPEAAQRFQPQMETLAKNKSFLERNSKFGQRTLLTSALVLGAAGVSWAAFNYLNEDEKSTMLDTVTSSPEAAAAPEAFSAPEAGAVDHHGSGLMDDLQGSVAGAPLVDEEALQAYIDEHTTMDDEIMSLLGILPSPAISLTLQYKMQIFSALVKTV